MGLPTAGMVRVTAARSKRGTRERLPRLRFGREQSARACHESGEVELVRQQRGAFLVSVVNARLSSRFPRAVPHLYARYQCPMLASTRLLNYDRNVKV
jgi:hypothetical protein